MLCSFLYLYINYIYIYISIVYYILQRGKKIQKPVLKLDMFAHHEYAYIKRVTM